MKARSRSSTITVASANRAAPAQRRPRPGVVFRMSIRTVVSIAGTGAILFVAAGTVRWPGAWAYLIEIGALGLAAGLWLARHDPELLEERLTSPIQREQRAWDRMLVATLLFLGLAWLVLIALDAVRYDWSHVPIEAHILGGVLILVSFYVGYLTFRENSYATPTVKIQEERGQEVISTGPYRYVRHPMYAGVTLLCLGAPLLLGSWYGLALCPLVIAVLGVRAVMEERTLKAELNGYTEYANRVRHRLIPLVW